MSTRRKVRSALVEKGLHATPPHQGQENNTGIDYVIPPIQQDFTMKNWARDRYKLVTDDKQRYNILNYATWNDTRGARRLLTNTLHFRNPLAATSKSTTRQRSRKSRLLLSILVYGA